MISFLTLRDVNVANKRVLIREDFNVPISDGKVANTMRIQAAIPGIKLALQSAAQVLLMSHLGRPQEGHWQAEFSLQQIIPYLEYSLDCEITFIKDWPVKRISNNKLILLENVRFINGETENSPLLAKQMAALCDVFVMDAFGSAHRAHASTEAVIRYAPLAVAGPLLTAEVQALDRIMQSPQRPLVAIIGGAKVSTKLAVLKNLQKMVDVLIVGGGMANTLLAASGHNVAASLCEPDMLDAAKELLASAKCKIILPLDIITQTGITKKLTAIQPGDKILDVGAETVLICKDYIENAATIIWNGPLGLFEDPRFANGTNQIAQFVANAKAFSVAGGGETLSAIDQLGLTKKISYLSTGGGAFLEYIEGKDLPSITALQKRNIC